MVNNICQGCYQALLEPWSGFNKRLKYESFGVDTSSILPPRKSLSVWDSDLVNLYTSVNMLLPEDSVVQMFNRCYDLFLKDAEKSQMIQNKLENFDLKSELESRSSDVLNRYQLTVSVSSKPESFDYSGTDASSYTIEFDAYGDYFAMLGFRLIMSDDESSVVDTRYLMKNWNKSFLEKLVAECPDVNSLRNSNQLRELRYDDPYASARSLVNLSTRKRLFGR